MTFHSERRHLAEDLILWETSGSPSPEEWQALLAGLVEWLTEAERRGRPLRLILDPSKMTSITATTRRLFAEFRAENLPLIANSVACAAYVADHPLLRAALTASFWLAPPVVPVQICGSREAALVWVEARAPRMAVGLP